jgi:thiol-disulfide isomerase/thioredoxin
MHSSLVAVVMFSSKFCKICEAALPVFENLQQSQPNIAFGIISDCAEVQEMEKVDTFPQFHLFRKGKKQKIIVGNELPTVEALLSQLLEAQLIVFTEELIILGIIYDLFDLLFFFFFL